MLAWPHDLYTLLHFLKERKSLEFQTQFTRHVHELCKSTSVEQKRLRRSGMPNDVITAKLSQDVNHSSARKIC